MSKKYNFIDTTVLLFRVVVLGVLMVPYIFVQVISKLLEKKEGSGGTPL